VVAERDVVTERDVTIIFRRVKGAGTVSPGGIVRQPHRARCRLRSRRHSAIAPVRVELK
jgi:hypothetical protein